MDKAPFLRSNSLQASMMTTTVKRPTIPTGNMLTESLMAAAAEERRRKKSISASIRYLANDKAPASMSLSFWAVLIMLIVMTCLSIILAVLHFGYDSDSECLEEGPATEGYGGDVLPPNLTKPDATLAFCQTCVNDD